MVKQVVILTYLEWIRLIRNTWIRFDKSRIVSYNFDSNNQNPEYYLDCIAELMRHTPDVDESSTGFILVVLKDEKTNFEAHSSLVADLGHRFKLSMVESFYSLTDNALMQHEFDAKAAGIEIEYAPIEFLTAWSTWREQSKSIADNYRGELLLSRFQLNKDANDYERILQGLEFLKQNVVEDKIIKSQDTMFYGWSYILNVLKNLNDSEKNLNAKLKAEFNSRQSDYKTSQTFLLNTQLLQDYVSTYLPNDTIKLNLIELLAIATYIQYERYVFKNEGRNFSRQNFEEDVQILKELNEQAAAFLVYKLGALLHERDIESMGNDPVVQEVDEEILKNSSINIDEKTELSSTKQEDEQVQTESEVNDKIKWVESVSTWSPSLQRRLIEEINAELYTIDVAIDKVNENRNKEKTKHLIKEWKTKWDVQSVIKY